eukprot:UN05348
MHPSLSARNALAYGFFRLQRGCCEFSFGVEYIEGPNNGRHSCRKCGQLIHVSLFKRDIVYINAGLFEFSERLTRERLEHFILSSHQRSAHPICRTRLV